VSAMLDREVLELLREDPDLLAIADAVVVTQRAEPQRRGGTWRLLGVAAVVAVAAVIAVVAPWHGHGNGLIDRALAAVGHGRVLHAVIESDAPNEQVVNLDYASTLSDAAGVTPGRTQDGLSLMPLLADPAATLPRNGFVIEHHAVRDQVPDFCGVRDHNWMYAQYSDGEEELYDLNPASPTYDPYQLQNQASNPAFSATLNAERAKAHTLCDPPPPGWVWHH